nr:type II secretion system protein N [uncultured Pseudomonas sp.]
MRSRLSRLQQQAPLLLGILLIVLMSISLAWQTLGWFRLARTPPAGLDTPSPSDHRQHAAPAQLAALFGTVAQENGPPPTTNLRLTLLGSFVHADPQRSSAIVQREGSASQRVAIGSELADGIRLHAVYLDRIELERQGRLETLPFPITPPTQIVAADYSASAYDDSAYIEPPQYDEPVGELGDYEEESPEQLEERLDALRKQVMLTSDQVIKDLDEASAEQPTERN